MEDVSDYFKGEYRKSMQMYEAGVETGIKFAVDYFMVCLDHEMRAKMVEQMMDAYDGR